MSETMSIHRALKELKTLRDRIEKAVAQPYVTIRVGDEGVPDGYKSVEDFEKRAKANLQSAQDLIVRRNKIKGAVIASNARVVVKVGDKQFTVAEAIDRMDSLDNERLLLRQLVGQANNVNHRLEGERRIMEQRIEKRIEDMGGKDKKVSASEVEEIETMVKKRYQPHLVDPIGIVDRIDELRKEIEQFEIEIDSVLSESNARETIEI